MRELELIKDIRKRAGDPGKGIKKGIGDDCAVIDQDGGRYLLWASDMLVEGTHFELKKAGYKSIGRKAASVNISDIAAMGGVPQNILVSIGIPKKIKNASIKSIYDGIFSVCDEHNVKVIGGDIARSDKLVIDISIMGFVKKDLLIQRSGAKPGDLILITGPVRDGRKTHLDFSPRMKESKFLASGKKITSMIDVSDGIALDISRICDESGVGCVIYSDDIPLSGGLELEDALYYGESFELLFTMKKKDAEKLAAKKQTGYFIIGEITKKVKGLSIVDKDGKKKKLKKKGFEHL